MKCLNYLNFVTNAFLTGWYFFTFFPVVPFWHTPLVILDFCFILLATNTAIWTNLVGAHRSKLEVEDFIFHVVVFSKVWHGNSCFAFRKKVSGFIFPNFVLVQYIVLQKLLKTNPRRLNTFYLFQLLVGGMQLFKLIETRS